MLVKKIMQAASSWYLVKELDSQSFVKARLIERSRLLAIWLAIIAMACPVLAAIGWIYNISVLTRGFPNLPSMQHNTAFGLLIGAIGLLLSTENIRSLRSRTSCFLAIILLILGLLTFSEYLFSVDLYIDRLFLFGLSSQSNLFLYAGRPAPQAALNFILLGLALFSLNRRWVSVDRGQTCAIILGGNALIAGTAYSFSSSQFYDLFSKIPGIGMAVTTSFGFLALAGAILFRRPTIGVMTTFINNTRSSALARKVVLICVLLPPIVGGLTSIGVIIGWYDSAAQVSLFAVVIIGAILRATWLATVHAESEEIRARAAFDSVKAMNVDLQEAVETREKVLAIVSHDLKNPLNVISLAGALLQQPELLDTPLISGLSTQVHRAVHQMERLIGDLLDFAKIKGGTFAVDMCRNKPIEFISPVFESMRVLADAKRQHFIAEVSPTLKDVNCDTFRIGQVLSNLLGNAIKFTPEGGTIRLIATETRDGLLVSVSDTGPGIPSEQLPKVFDRLWQAEGSHQLGSGLGLAIAKGIIDSHSSQIWVESQVGCGSCFLFTLPFATEQILTTV